MIFEKPILASVSHQVAGTTLTLYEFTADLYYEHVLNPEALAEWDKARASRKDADDITEPDASNAADQDSVDYEQICAARRMSKEDKLLWIACSLSPGYPKKSITDIVDELRHNLNGVNLESIYQKVWDLNVPAAAKKTESPAVDSSIG